MRKLQETKPSFEETYSHYPFSELVRLGVVVAQWLAGWRNKRAGPAQSRQPPPRRRTSRASRELAARRAGRSGDLAA